MGRHDVVGVRNEPRRKTFGLASASSSMYENAPLTPRTGPSSERTRRSGWTRDPSSTKAKPASGCSRRAYILSERQQGSLEVATFGYDEMPADTDFRVNPSTGRSEPLDTLVSGQNPT
jgi:hypothetical protein